MVTGWAVHSAAGAAVLSADRICRGSRRQLRFRLLSARALLALSRARVTRQAMRPTPAIPAWAYRAAPFCARRSGRRHVAEILRRRRALADPIFDHSKIAIIDAMARLGLPPVNPLFGETRRAVRLAYYYLWHFSAAELALVARRSGWEADIALTGSPPLPR